MPQSEADAGAVKDTLKQVNELPGKNPDKHKQATDLAIKAGPRAAPVVAREEAKKESDKITNDELKRITAEMKAQQNEKALPGYGDLMRQMQTIADKPKEEIKIAGTGDKPNIVEGNKTPAPVNIDDVANKPSAAPTVPGTTTEHPLAQRDRDNEAKAAADRALADATKATKEPEPTA